MAITNLPTHVNNNGNTLNHYVLRYFILFVNLWCTTGTLPYCLQPSIGTTNFPTSIFQSSLLLALLSPADDAEDQRKTCAVVCCCSPRFHHSVSYRAREIELFGQDSQQVAAPIEYIVHMYIYNSTCPVQGLLYWQLAHLPAHVVVRL